MRTAMANVFLPDPDRLCELGYSGFKDVPVLFDDDERYCFEINQYLRERAALDWSPFDSDVPRRLTLKKIAYNLKNWLEWCHLNGVSWRTASYQNVLDYQHDQATGKWSKSGNPLEPSTCNHRADDVTWFLTWAAHRRLREPFIYTTIAKRLRIGGRHVNTEVRTNREKEDYTGSSFRLPKPKAVREWLQRVLTKRGYVKYLACRFILEAGPRRAEVEALHKEDWPSAEAIVAARHAGDSFVEMRLTRGTKGGRRRKIRVPIRFAEEVQVWIDKKRGTYLRALNRRTGELSDKLFLSDRGEHAGTPISAATVYDCFHAVEPPAKGWSPHKGRAAFACFFMLHALADEAAIQKKQLDKMAADWICDRGAYWLRLLRDQFGHASEETTARYLRWLVHASAVAEMASGWHRFLNGREVKAA